MLPRQAFFVVFSAFLLLCPALPQVFKVYTPAIRRWVMFSGYGTDICEVRYTVADGEQRRPIERCEALGYEEGCFMAPRSVKNLADKPAVDAFTRRLCKKLGPEVELRLTARCATTQGWQERYNGRRDICEVMDELAAEEAKQ